MRPICRHASWLVCGGIIGAVAAGLATGWMWWWVAAATASGALAAVMAGMAAQRLLAGIMSKPYQP